MVVVENEVRGVTGRADRGDGQSLLEQAATMADQIRFEFADGEIHRIPSCFYEFAKRYPSENGEIFQGFVTGNADKIFESTDAK